MRTTMAGTRHGCGGPTGQMTSCPARRSRGATPSETLTTARRLQSPSPRPLDGDREQPIERHVAQPGQLLASAGARRCQIQRQLDPTQERLQLLVGDAADSDRLLVTVEAAGDAHLGVPPGALER